MTIIMATLPPGKKCRQLFLFQCVSETIMPVADRPDPELRQVVLDLSLMDVSDTHSGSTSGHIASE